MTDFNSLTKLDKEHIFDAIDAQPDHLRLQFADSMGDDVTPEWGVGLTSIVLAGMGGSALAADGIRNWLGGTLSVPFEIVRGYTLPEYVGPATLTILSSFSGNTEETLAALEAAEKRSARIVIMTAGGKLLEIARAKGYLTLQLPQVSQPRFAVMAGMRALACLLGDAGLAGENDLRRELQDAGDWLDIAKSKLSLDNPSDDNLARKMALALHGSPVVIYAGMSLRAAVYKWKININENAKQLAWCNVFPELNHNEFQGWVFPEKKHLNTVLLQSTFEHERIIKRLDITRAMLKEHGYEPLVVTAEGSTPLQQLLWSIMLGDYVSSYLGILNGVDPSPVAMVEEFKKKLG